MFDQANHTDYFTDVDLLENHSKNRQSKKNRLMSPHIWHKFALSLVPEVQSVVTAADVIERNLIQGFNKVSGQSNLDF